MRSVGADEPRSLTNSIADGLARFTEAGIGFEFCAIGLEGKDDTEAITEALTKRPWEVVLIGGGVRRADDRIELFENVVNLVRQQAPGAAIAFNVRPGDIFDAAARWLKPSS